MKWILELLWPPKDRAKTPPGPVRGRYQLHVFRKTDGGRLFSLPVPGGADGVPLVATKARPLKPRANGVECFGTRAVFDGDLHLSSKP